MIANGDMYTRADMAEIKALSGCRCESESFVPSQSPRVAVFFSFT